MAKSKNMLEFVPKRSKKINWQIRETGLVRICVKHRGFYSKLAQMLVKAPPISNIDMDQFGSFIWNAIDGRRRNRFISEKISFQNSSNCSYRIVKICKRSESKFLLKSSGL